MSGTFRALAGVDARPVDGPFGGVQQKEQVGTLPAQRFHTGRGAGGQGDFLAERGLEHREQPNGPFARLGLPEAKEHALHLLDRIQVHID